MIRVPMAGAAVSIMVGWMTHIIPLLWLGFVLVLVSAVVLLFFRDPERTPPVDPGAVVAPADGKVIVSEILPDGCGHVAIFLSVLDVHINRAPFTSRVTRVLNRPGTYFHAGSSRAAEANARVEIEAESAHGPIAWRQLSGSIARKISCRVQPGDVLQTGQRFGLIYFGSRMDVFLPPTATLTSTAGMRVIAGESVIAKFS